MTAFRDDMTLEEARDELRARAADGERCPCCTQNVKVYRRKLTAVASRGVATLYRHHGLGWAHLPSVVREHLPEVATQGGYLTLGAHWNLIEEQRRVRPDGGRTGWWRVTVLGEMWLQGHATVPQHAHIFDGRLLRLDGDQVTAEEALGEGFDLVEILHGAAATPPLGRAA